MKNNSIRHFIVRVGSGTKIGLPTFEWRHTNGGTEPSKITWAENEKIYFSYVSAWSS